MGSWYPFNWLPLPLPWAANLSVLVHLILGGGGMYALARRWGVNGFAASFAGLAYVFNGVTLSCFQWSNYIASLGWLPWVVLAVTEAWRGGHRQRAASADRHAGIDLAGLAVSRRAVAGGIVFRKN
jgi:hypothetical protein